LIIKREKEKSIDGRTDGFMDGWSDKHLHLMGEDFMLRYAIGVDCLLAIWLCVVFIESAYAVHLVMDAACNIFDVLHVSSRTVKTDTE